MNRHTEIYLIAVMFLVCTHVIKIGRFFVLPLKEYVHVGLIGGPKQKNDIPLGNKCYFYANIVNCFGHPTWPPCTYSIADILFVSINFTGEKVFLTFFRPNELNVN